jgi:hypothetical protein
VSEYRYTTDALAAEFSVSPKTIRRRAANLRIGINLEGRAGWRYSEADRQKLIDSLKPPAPVKQRRKRRAA